MDEDNRFAELLVVGWLMFSLACAIFFVAFYNDFETARVIVIIWVGSFIGWLLTAIGHVLYMLHRDRRIPEYEED